MSHTFNLPTYLHVKAFPNVKSIICALHLFFALALAVPREDAQTAMLEYIYAWQPAGINDCSSYLISFPAKSALLIFIQSEALAQ